MSSIVHLVRRFATSLSRNEPPPGETSWGLGHLLPTEAELWQRMAAQDRRHSLLVARRFAERQPDHSRAELAAALLHDIGKVECGLGTWRRVLATVVGPRTAAFRRYHDHERIGAELLAEAGSDAATIDLVLGRGRAATALRAADDI
ncbi:MAG: HD domain-containing protein [Ilumatobacteraceae bacterium]